MKSNENFWNEVRFNENGLLPAVIQDASNNEVLMVAYMNRESLEKSLATGRTWFYSRSRQCLWLKGETSGHYQNIKEVYYDCDADTLLFKVDQVGVACHQGYRSCFYRRLYPDKSISEEAGKGVLPRLNSVLDDLFALIKERQVELPESSYTSKLFRLGLDRIAQKVGEEAVEVLIAAKNRDRSELVYEMADLWYHCLVILAEVGITPEEVVKELARRRK